MVSISRLCMPWECFHHEIVTGTWQALNCYKTKNYWTPLRNAARLNKTSMVNYLLQQEGIDVEALDEEGLKIEDVGCIKTKIKRLLTKHEKVKEMR